jgi:hypothetical protein
VIGSRTGAGVLVQTEVRTITGAIVAAGLVTLMVWMAVQR